MRPELPVLLLVQPASTLREQIVRALSLGHHAAVSDVPDVDEALHSLAAGIAGLAAVLVPWPLPDDGVQRFLDGLNIIAPRPRPAVLIYGDGLTPHDLTDLADAGATSLIAAPPRLDQVVRELVSLRQSGTSPGRARLLAGAGARPAGTPKRTLAGAKDAAWRDRMVRLASGSRTRNPEARRAKLLELLVCFDELAGRRVSLAHVECLYHMARNDARGAETLIRAEGLDRGVLDASFRAVEEKLQFRVGQPAPRATVVQALEEIVELARQRRRGETWTQTFSELKVAATDLALGRCAPEAPQAAPFRDRKSTRLNSSHT